MDQSNVQSPSENDHLKNASEDWRRAMWTHSRCMGAEHEDVVLDQNNMNRLQLEAAKLPSPVFPQGFP